MLLTERLLGCDDGCWPVEKVRNHQHKYAAQNDDEKNGKKSSRNAAPVRPGHIAALTVSETYRHAGHSCPSPGVSASGSTGSCSFESGMTLHDATSCVKILPGTPAALIVQCLLLIAAWSAIGNVAWQRHRDGEAPRCFDELTFST